jgi:uncharacterized DUF497 family protein
VHLVGFLFIVVIADARNHEPERKRYLCLVLFMKLIAVCFHKQAKHIISICIQNAAPRNVRSVEHGVTTDILNG